MKLTERIALIRAGYTKKEIAELELSEMDKPEPVDDDTTEEPVEESQEDNSEEEAEPDYKAEYGRLSEQIAELEKKLEQAQKNNIKKNLDIPEPKDPQEELQKIIDGFY